MSDVTRYLREELRTAQRRLRITSIAMVVLVVAMLGYFQWIKSMTADVLQPVSIAEFLTNEVRRNMPDAAHSVSTSLVDAAPDVVRYAMLQVSEQVLPQLTESIGAELKSLATEAARVGTQGVNAAYAEAVTECQRTLPKSPKRTADMTVDSMSACLRKQLPTALDAKSEEILGGRLQESAAMLRQIDAKLRALATDERLSREDQLGKQVVTAWWTFLERNHPAVGDVDL